MDYVDEEDGARVAHAGMWAGTFDWPGCQGGKAQQELGHHKSAGHTSPAGSRDKGRPESGAKRRNGLFGLG